MSSSKKFPSAGNKRKEQEQIEKEVPRFDEEEDKPAPEDNAEKVGELQDGPKTVAAPPKPAKVTIIAQRDCNPPPTVNKYAFSTEHPGKDFKRNAQFRVPRAVGNFLEETGNAIVVRETSFE